VASTALVKNLKNMTVTNRRGMASGEPMIVELAPGDQGVELAPGDQGTSSDDSLVSSNPWGSEEWENVPTVEGATVTTADSEHKPQDKQHKPASSQQTAPPGLSDRPDALEQEKIRILQAEAQIKVLAARADAAARAERDAEAATERAMAAEAAAVERRLIAERAMAAAAAAAAAAERAAAAAAERTAAAAAAATQSQQKEQPAAPRQADQQDDGRAASGSTGQQPTVTTVARYVRSIGNRTNRDALLAAARLDPNKGGRHQTNKQSMPGPRNPPWRTSKWAFRQQRMEPGCWQAPWKTAITVRTGLSRIWLFVVLCYILVRSKLIACFV
jgi:hypothetical protein